MNDLFLSAVFLTGNQFSLSIDIQQRAYIEHLSDHPRCLRYAPAPDEKRKIGGKEPVHTLQLIVLSPIMNFINTHT